MLHGQGRAYIYLRNLYRVLAPTYVLVKEEVMAKKDRKKCRTNIGGQAVLEGVMMLGARSRATAVRDEKGNIQIESKRIKPNSEKSIFRKIPFVRGVLNFVSSMYTGVGIILRSSEVFEGESEPSKFEKWCADRLHLNVMSVIMGISVILGLGLSIGLFFVLPHFIRVGFEMIPGADKVHPLIFQLVEGVVRICIFVAYIMLTSLMKEIKRVYMYHGAEHKTISCHEHGLELTIENVQKQSTIHDRCGTTFMFLVMVISILVFAVTGAFDAPTWAQLLIKLALLPVVAGISYEILKFLARFDNWFVDIIKAPGLLLQKVTTKQPTDDMVEVAIAAFTTVAAMDKDLSIAEQTFDTKVMYNKARAKLEETLKDCGDVSSDIDWIVCSVLGIKRSEVAGLSYIRSGQMARMQAMVDKRKDGMPLQQILGNTDFYGLIINVTDKVLCPRPETEYLVEQATKIINDNNFTTVLDLCTGSGAIAIAIKNLCPNVSVAASDMSQDAIDVAKSNAEINNMNIEFATRDMLVGCVDKYDIVVSNPPYIPSEDIADLDKTVKDHEPIMALDGGSDGLDFYKAIAVTAPRCTNSNGYLALEVGIGQAQAVSEILAQKYENIQVYKDLEGVDRIVIARIKVAE